MAPIEIGSENRSIFPQPLVAPPDFSWLTSQGVAHKLRAHKVSSSRHTDPFEVLICLAVVHSTSDFSLQSILQPFKTYVKALIHADVGSAGNGSSTSVFCLPLSALNLIVQLCQQSCLGKQIYDCHLVWELISSQTIHRAYILSAWRYVLQFSNLTKKKLLN